MLRGYFDDSGTHTGGGAGASRIVVVSAVLMSDEQYELFSETWRHILSRNGLAYFHLTKLKTGKTPPYSGMTVSERDTLLDQFVRLMSVRVKMSCSAAVPVGEYESVLSPEEKRRYGSPYAWAAQYCWIGIRIWAEKHDYPDPIPFVVESGPTRREEEHMSIVFNKTMANPTLKRLGRLDSLVCGDKKDYPGLQAADILANSSYEIADHEFTGGREPSRWMRTVARHVRKMDHHQLVTHAEILRSETDELNRLYEKSIAEAPV